MADEVKQAKQAAGNEALARAGLSPANGRRGVNLCLLCGRVPRIIGGINCASFKFGEDEFETVYLMCQGCTTKLERASSAKREAMLDRANYNFELLYQAWREGRIRPDYTREPKWHRLASQAEVLAQIFGTDKQPRREKGVFAANKFKASERSEILPAAKRAQSSKRTKRESQR